MEFFDIETIETGNKKIRPYALCFSDKSEIKYLRINGQSNETLAELVLLNFKNNTHYYAHNLLFDFLQILPGLINLKIKFKWVFLEDNLYGARIFYKDKVIYFKCSYKLIPYPLREFYPNLSSTAKLYFPYEALNFSGLKKPCYSFSDIDPRFSKLRLYEYLQIYAKNDVLMLREGVLSFWANLKRIGIDFNKNIYTCGSISLNFYIKNWNKINLNLCKKSKNLVRQAYFGGRCEVFGNKREGEKVLHFDFKGMYQQCMAEKLPFGDLVWEEGPFLNTHEPGFYFIKIKYLSELPILPSREDKLYFKDGRISGWFWYEEINLVKKYCKIQNLEILYRLRAVDYGEVLLEFTQTLNKIRELGGISKEIGKLLINSFYGRMALGEEVSSIKLTHELLDAKSYGRIGDFFITKKNQKKNPKANIAVAAAITSKARIKLYEGFMSVLDGGGRLLYCDTDSIIAAFPDNLSVEDKWLGEVFFDTSKEDTSVSDCVFISPKTYGLRLANGKEVIKIKGINLREINLNELKESFFASKNLVLGSNVFSKKNLSIEILLEKKEINVSSYNKRIWDEGRFSTRPITR